MNLQFISDNNGKTTGVFIPIQDWDMFLKKYNIQQEDTCNVLEWQKEIIRDRVKNANPEDYVSLENAKKITHGI